MMKLVSLPILVTLSLLVSLTAARLLPFRLVPRMRNNALRYAVGPQPLNIIEGESFNAELGETYFNPSLGGAVISAPLSRSFNPPYAPVSNAEGGYQPESNALPWVAY